MRLWMPLLLVLAVGCHTPPAGTAADGGPNEDAGPVDAGTTDAGPVDAGSSEFALPQPADFSQQTWTVAFDAMHDKFSREYAFTDWKGIHWDQLRATYRPRIVEAEQSKDAKAFYLALREYVFQIPDGHVSLDGSDQGTMDEAVGGGTGLALAELDDGRIIITAALDGSPAAAATIPAGSELLQWNGQPVQDAIAATTTLWTDGAMATNEGRQAEQIRFLTRAPVGTVIPIVYRPPGGSATVAVSLTAASDSYAWLSATDPLSSIDDSHTVQSRILPEGIGYVRLEAELDISAVNNGKTDPAQTIEPVFNAFKKAIQSFVDAKVSGVIVDLRANTGGDDDLGRRLVGFFYPQPGFWETGTFYNDFTGRIEIPPMGSTVYTVPQQPLYDGPVVALVDYDTLSSGEGVTLALKRSPHGKVVGAYGTFGAFGQTGGEIDLPKGLTLSYPYGQSLDQNGHIQIDSDASGNGGVLPDVRIPRTYERAMSLAQGIDVDVQFAVSELQGMQ